uniref:Protein kinase domain-containing protein n=1 Tax=Macrostomum lignano TaxID=282301 RepID=A0A1I8FIQ0_9PLAT
LQHQQMQDDLKAKEVRKGSGEREKPLSAGPSEFIICSALSYMHGREPPVIHRDINCSNMIVHVTASTSSPKGTLNFLAAELLSSQMTQRTGPRYSRKSDIWAFGCSVYQMASVRDPTTAVNFLQMALQLERAGAPELPDGTSLELKDFYSRCTAKDRSQRQSAAELMEAEFLKGIQA